MGNYDIERQQEWRERIARLCLIADLPAPWEIEPDVERWKRGRSTRLGHLVLGASFNWPDLVAYVVGIALGVVAECIALVPLRGRHSGAH